MRRIEASLACWECITVNNSLPGMLEGGITVNNSLPGMLEREE